ncbi:hypothetical protein K2173_028504 [Erythroxylum novogranatense]|uniref:Uncharacterized protein n=1 Tax=Erythroxylum novogranatense TaxID=1862640 RepID=A0AAV8U207_9ROSI|nr:hypothetical protein K2173_028504 [Erythroxylum novogranatense]
MENGDKLQIVVFPWLAMGHLIPYFRNLMKLPKIPENLSSQIKLISFPLPHVPNLPPNAESSADVTYSKQQLLKKGLDSLKQPLTAFLESSRPDWVIFDYASHWLPSTAKMLGISTAFFSLFTASCLCFICPPSVAINGENSRSKAEDFTVVPEWVPFESTITYRLYEVTKYVEKTEEDVSGPSDDVRFGVSAGECDVVLIRSLPEFEPEWFNLLQELYKKPIVPVGFLPPIPFEDEETDDWITRSVIYVALGTEVALTREEVHELAFGLEKSMLPFVWVLKDAPGSTENVLEMLPDGFKERVNDRGLVYRGWVPQANVLSHESVGGFLTHCGWNSVIEGLTFGKALVLLPFINDQGLNARLLEEKKLGREVPRNEHDGSFTRESVAESVRMATVGNTAEELRDLFIDENRNNGFIEMLVKQLQEGRKRVMVA